MSTQPTRSTVASACLLSTIEAEARPMCCPSVPDRRTAVIRHNRLDLSPTLTAVILAAGHGTRMRSRIPKVLHPICGRPMIDWVLAAGEEAGAKDVKGIANPHHADVAAHLDGGGEVVYQRDPKGTAHALGQIPAGEVRGRQVLVGSGDSSWVTSTRL